MSEKSNYIKVGMSSCGLAAGAEAVYNALKNYVKEKNLPVKIEKTGCLGICYAEPLIEVKVDEKPSVLYKNVNKDLAIRILENIFQGQEAFKEYEVSEYPKQKKIVLKNCGRINPENIDDYIENQGYQAIKKVLNELGIEKTLEEIKKSGLRGRGGAGYPTWLKWKFTKEVEDTPKFIICNGDEGDPGAYMDRSVMEGDPHSIIEGMMIAGYVTGASRGFFFIRAEYPLAIERIQKAIDVCYEKNFLGNRIFGSDFNFDMEVRFGAGAFVCGEETSLIASIEGRRGYPSHRPPYPAIKGLWQKPTVINNVETLANIPYIILNGGENYSKIGTKESPGTKVFALTGKIKKPGLVEVPMGTTLREIVEDIGGGVENSEKIKAVQTGGPSGGLIPEKYLDTPISYESLEELGSIMGSGGMIVMDDSDSMIEVAKFFMKFCVEESCGKCAPCRIGTSQILNNLEKISEGKGKLKDIEGLEKICNAMKKAAFCGLGQSAPNPVLSTLKYFKNEYEELLNDKSKNRRD